MSYTTNPNDPRLGHGSDLEPIPQHEVYLVLFEDELAKGFKRKFQCSINHWNTSRNSHNDSIGIQ